MSLQPPRSPTYSAGTVARAITPRIYHARHTFPAGSSHLARTVGRVSQTYPHAEPQASTMVLPQWAEPTPPEQPTAASRALALVVAALAVLGLVVTWSLLVVHPQGSALDDSAVDGASYGSSTDRKSGV